MLTRMKLCVVLFGIGLSGCPDPRPGTNVIGPGACPKEDILDGVCMGVPSNPVCDAKTCVVGVACTQTIAVGSDPKLQSALSGASPGTCIALEPGDYGFADVPGGVRLLGRAAAEVKLKGVTLAAGKGAVLRGLTVGAGGIRIVGAKDVRIEAVHTAGIAVESGSVVTILQSTVQGSAAQGLRATGETDITIRESVISESAEAGVWVACDDCPCAAEPAVTAPRLTMIDTIVRDNRSIGVALFGTVALVDNVDIVRTSEVNFSHGGGLSVAACSFLQATGLRVWDNASYGVLIDESSATLGSPFDGEGLEVSGNQMGVWIQNVQKSGVMQTVVVENAEIVENAGVGLGVSGQSRGIIVCKSNIAGTTMKALPVMKNGEPVFADDVGDGFSWQEGSEVVVDELTLSGNARASLVIDSAVSGSLSKVTADGSVVHQRETGQATIDYGGLAVEVLATEKFSVPQGLSIISK